MNGGQFVCVAMLLLAPVAVAQDAYSVKKQDQSVIHESDWLRVRKVTYQPGERVPMHEHKARVVVFLSDGVVRGIAPDGKTQDTEFHRGMVQWSEPVRHSLENAGNTPLVAIEAELLGPHPAGPQAFTGNPAQQDPKHFHVEFENERVRVLRYRLGPHESSPMHDHLDRITVRLDDAHFRTTLPDGSKQERHEKAGEAGFHSSSRHAFENLSDSRFEAISIEFKSPAR